MYSLWSDLKRSSLMICACLVLSLGTPQAIAKPALSKAQAAKIVSATYPGRILKVKRQNGVYTVKLVTQKGRVKQVKVDAKTGEIR